MKNLKVRQVVLPLLAAVIWGGSFVTQSLSASRMGTFSFGMMRMILASLFLLVLVGISRRLHPREKYTREQKKTLLIGGIACGVMPYRGHQPPAVRYEGDERGQGGIYHGALHRARAGVRAVYAGKKPKQTRVDFS